MKVKVLISFHDASNFAKVYQVGEIVEFSEERAEALQRLNLVAPFEEEKKEVKEEPKSEKPKRAKKQR